MAGAYQLDGTGYITPIIPGKRGYPFLGFRTSRYMFNLILQSAGDYNIDDKYTAQTKVFVEDGKATSEGFSEKGKKLSGDYDLVVSMSIPGLQSDAVRAAIGNEMIL